ncbi:MAG: hypothetical protein MUF01_06245 [Bryobacterales bacterium]|jgi:hypothetical protein|nr:hypothetical protein [Bryobacterales bacterium]
MRPYCLPVLLVLCFATMAVAQPAATDAANKPLRVLFIGNSYTGYSNLPYLLEQVSASQKNGPRIQTGQSLSGGKTLQWHWTQGQALKAIRQGGWDFVVLQEQSLLGNTPKAGENPYVNAPAQYEEFAAKFDAEIRKVGARTVLYATWARDGYPEQQRRLDDAFTRVAASLNAVIVPVGLGFTVTRIEAPSVSMHMPDRSHPTMAGSYLATLLFYQCLTGRRVSAPPAVIEGPVGSESTRATLVNLPWSDASTLNQIASRVASAEPRCPVR